MTPITYNCGYISNCAPQWENDWLEIYEVVQSPLWKTWAGQWASSWNPQRFRCKNSFKPPTRNQLVNVSHVFRSFQLSKTCQSFETLWNTNTVWGVSPSNHIKPIPSLPLRFSSVLPLQPFPKHLESDCCFTYQHVGHSTSFPLCNGQPWGIRPAPHFTDPQNSKLFKIEGST